MDNSNSKGREVSAGIKTLTNLGLSGTNPIYIADANLHEFDNKRGYILYVLEDTVFDAGSKLSIEGSGFIGATIGAGYYHIISTAIKLVSGSLIVYRAV